MADDDDLYMNDGVSQLHKAVQNLTKYQTGVKNINANKFGDGIHNGISNQTQEQNRRIQREFPKKQNREDSSDNQYEIPIEDTADDDLYVGVVEGPDKEAFSPPLPERTVPLLSKKKKNQQHNHKGNSSQFNPTRKSNATNNNSTTPPILPDRPRQNFIKSSSKWNSHENVSKTQKLPVPKVQSQIPPITRKVTPPEKTSLDLGLIIQKANQLDETTSNSTLKATAHFPKPAKKKHSKYNLPLKISNKSKAQSYHFKGSPEYVRFCESIELSYFHPKAEDTVLNEEGMYMIRASSSTPNCLVLCVRSGSTVFCFRIFFVKSGLLELQVDNIKEDFTTLEELIQNKMRYSIRRESNEIVHLTKPYVTKIE